MRTKLTLVLAMILAAVAVLALASTADAVGPTCDGKVATITQPGGSIDGVQYYYGTPGDDVIVGTGAKEGFLGGGGNDRICGGGGDDYLDGASGTDRLFGGFGSDHLSGGAGDDDLEGYDGKDDRCFGGDGSDKAHRSCEVVKRIEQRYS